MHRRTRPEIEIGLNRQLCISGSAPALQVGGSRSSTPVKPKKLLGGPHSQLVGQLSSTFAAPLEECSTLENLHRVALQISGRVASHRMAFTALVTAVSGRCISMLRRGLSMEEAVSAMPLLGDLWRAGLLYVPGDTARTAVASALAILVSGGRKESPGSALLKSMSRPSSTGSGSRETLDQRLKRWCRSCELFEEAVSLDLLTREGATTVQEQLYEELKRTLAGSREDDMRKAASRIKLGSVPLCRACGLMARIRRPHPKRSNSLSGAEPPANELDPNTAKASEAAFETISAIAYEVVRNTEIASSVPAASARAALEENGIVEPDSTPHPSFLPSSSRPPSSRYSSFYAGTSKLDAGGSLSTAAVSSRSKFRDEAGTAALPEYEGPSVSHNEHIIAAARR
mmetsp:Transcript_35479/g.81882  ORF Transcript_35479/g.81882 Transcript_35479/m.81882 type:complete len:400 (+) Transcript_35479:117-1316(+)